MGSLTEANVYEEEIYQLELTDNVIGGANGIANRQAKQLANRTNWLKDKIDFLIGATFEAAKALKLSVARKITLGGILSGETTFDGSANVTINADIADGALSIAKTNGLQDALELLKDVPQNAKTAAYTLALTDRGKSIDVSTGGITITVPLNSAVAFPIGATVTITNLATTAITIASSATLKQAGTTNTGNRTLSANGMATIRKVAADTWFVGGAGVS